MAEYWNAYDDKFQVIENTILVRGEQIPDGAFHLVADVLVKHIDGTYLITQRNPNKNLGLRWEATSGGSALINESPLDCALRELREETGIQGGHIEELGRIVHYSYRTLYVEYLYITDCEKSSIVLQEGETIDYKWICFDELVQMRGSLASDIFFIFI